MWYFLDHSKQQFVESDSPRGSWSAGCLPLIDSKTLISSLLSVADICIVDIQLDLFKMWLRFLFI